jgi:hypothetical protein
MIISFSEAFAKRQAANATRAIEFRAQLCIFLSNHANDPACDYVAPTVVEQIAQAAEFMVNTAIHSHEIWTAADMRLDRANFALIGEAACVVALALTRLTETSKDWKLSAQIVIERLLGLYVSRDSAVSLSTQIIEAYTSDVHKLNAKRTKEIAELAVTAIQQCEDHAVARLADLLMPEFVAVA